MGKLVVHILYSFLIDRQTDRQIDRQTDSYLNGFLVDPIEVDSGQRGSVVAHDNAVRVHHGNHLEHTMAAKALGKERLDIT